MPVALASVAFCDDVLVVDSGSRDRTVQLARAAGARVIEHPWLGFGAQRNVAHRQRRERLDPRGRRRRADHPAAAV